MAIVNSEFGLPIFIADDGEKPQRGAFFAANANWSLSKIAKAAYNDASAWKIINKNGWNTSNLVYRADSTKCSSAKRESSWALTTLSPVASAKSAFIALCQKDAKAMASFPVRSFKFPVIWIPDLEKMPLPVSVKPTSEPETQPVGPAVFVDPVKADIDIAVDPGKPTSDGSGSGSGGSSSGGSSITTPGTPKPLEAGMGPFVLIGGGLLMLLGLLVWPVTKGKKRRR
jgi:hypothetical protein